MVYRIVILVHHGWKGLSVNINCVLLASCSIWKFIFTVLTTNFQKYVTTGFAALVTGYSKSIKHGTLKTRHLPH